MVVREFLQLQAIEGDSLCADRDFGQEWPDLGVKTVLVHSEKVWRMSKTDKSGLHVRIESPGKINDQDSAG